MADILHFFLKLLLVRTPKTLNITSSSLYLYVVNGVIVVELFFFGISDGSSKKAMESIDHKFNVMINYASKSRSIPRNTKKLFIDSGGFSFFYRMKDYPTPHREYLDFVNKMNADFFANRDYPNEPEVRKKWKVSVRENQMRTINNQIEIMSLIDDEYPHLKDRFVSVLQGWRIEEYLWMLDYMKEHGLLTRIVGLGTMCRRGKGKEIRNYIVTIRNNLPRKYKLHGFGIKFSILKYKDVWDALYSADSLAYRYYIRRDWENGITIQEQVEKRIRKWLNQLETLKKKHTNTKTLDTFLKLKNVSSDYCTFTLEDGVTKEIKRKVMEKCL